MRKGPSHTQRAGAFADWIIDAVKALPESATHGDRWVKIVDKLTEEFGTVERLTYEDCLEIAKDYTGQGVLIAGIIEKRLAGIA